MQSSERSAGGVRESEGKKWHSQSWGTSEELIRCPQKTRIVGVLLLGQMRNLGVSDNSGKFDALGMSGTGSPDLILRSVKLMRITGGTFWFSKGAHYHLVISVLSALSGLFILSLQHLWELETHCLWGGGSEAHRSYVISKDAEPRSDPKFYF